MTTLVPVNALRLVRAPIGAFLASIALVVGCLPLTGVTSGQIGCAPGDISISDEERSFDSETWKAECNGREYFCSRHGSENRYSTAQVSCSESTHDQASVAAAAPFVVIQGDGTAATRDDTHVCEAAYARVADFALYWAGTTPAAKILPEPPQKVDFVAVCHALPENVQRCTHSGYREVHVKACDAVLLRLEPIQRRKVDGLFFEAERAP
jgi:hypothetical protein